MFVYNCEKRNDNQVNPKCLSGIDPVMRWRESIW